MGLLKRIGLAAATGGLSEGYRAATGGRDPLDDLATATGTNSTDTHALDADIAATKALQPTIAGSYQGDRGVTQIGAAAGAPAPQRQPLGGAPVPGGAGQQQYAAAGAGLRATLGMAADPTHPGQIPGGNAPQFYPETSAGGLQTVAAPFVRTATAAAPGQVGAPTVNARQATGSAPVSSINVGAPTPVQAQTVQTQTAGPAAQATAGQGVATTALGATINAAPSNEVRTDQRGLVSNLQGVVAGTAPSVAAEMYRSSLADIADRGAAQVAAATGSGRAAAKRAALYSTADATQRSARDLALIRAQESATGRQQLGTVLDSTRGQDVGLATAQAGLDQGVNLKNAELTTGTSNQNAELGTRTALGNAAATNDTSRFNASQGNAVEMANAGNKLTADTGNARLSTDVETGNANRGTEVAVGNANRADDITKFNTGQGNTVDLANATNRIGVDTGNANRNLAGDQFNVGQTNDITKFSAGQQLDASKTNAAQEMQRQITNIDAMLKARGLDDAARDAYIKNLLAQNQQVLNADVGKIGIAQGDQQRRAALAGGLLDAGGTVAAAG